MASRIKLKRGLSTNIDSVDLQQGELALTTDTNELYTVDSKGNNVQIRIKASDTLPIGSIIPFSGTEVPANWLICDGSSLNIESYPDLYAVIGNTYGGDTENFNVPNLIGRFLEGANTSGEYVEAGLPNIEGEWGWQSNTGVVAHANTLSGAFTRSENLQNYGLYNVAQSNTANLAFDASCSNSIYGNSDTVQPKSLRVLYIIKARQNIGVAGNVVNNESISDKDTYSCDYINAAVSGVVKSTNITKIEKVTEYPSNPDENTLYIKVES